MKFLQLLFISSFVTLLSLGASLEASSYESGKSAYKEKDYERAVHYFKNSFAEYSNVDMQLLWAKSEKELGRPEYVMSAYERIISLEPKNLEVAFNLVELYKEIGQRQEVKKVILNFDDKDFLPHERSTSSKFLAVEYLKADKLSARITSTLGYDSEIGVIELDDNAYDLIGPLESISKDFGSSLFSKTTASASYLRDLTDRGDWFIITDVDALVRLDFHESLYNTKSIKAAGTVGYKDGNIMIKIPLEYKFTNYLGKNLLQSYCFSPSVSSILESKYIIDLSIKFLTKKHPGNLKIYDSSSYALSSSLKYLLGKDYATFGIEYLVNSAKNKDATLLIPSYVDSKLFNFSFDTVYHMKNGYMLTASYMIRVNYFDEKNHSIDSNGMYYLSDKQRKDNSYTLGLGASKDISDKTKITADYYYSRNITPYYASNYDKIVFSIGLEYNF